MGDTYYFSHDYTARNDSKIKSLLRRHNFLGYGIYWAIVEDLYINDNKLTYTYEDLAYDLHCDVNIVKSVIEDFGLFRIENGILSSDSVQKRLDKRNEKSLKASQSAKNRWGGSNNQLTSSESSNSGDANAMRTHSNGNAIKESKVNDSKEKDSVIAPASNDAVNVNENFLKFQAWQKENTPTLLQMKEPFTEKQFEKMKTKWHWTYIAEMCQRMHNYQPLLKKYKSAYLTFTNWVKLNEK